VAGASFGLDVAEHGFRDAIDVRPLVFRPAARGR
jgi:hypothetical protein